MSRNFTINVYPEPIEFSLTFDGDTTDPTVVHDQAISMKNFLGRLKAAGWEVEKGVAVQVDPDESISWCYELSEAGHAFDGDRGAGCMEDARQNALSALNFIMKNEGEEGGDIELKITQNFYRDIDGKAYKGRVDFIEKIDRGTGDHRFFIKGEDPHEIYAKNGIAVRFSHLFETYESAAAVFEKICSSSQINEYIDMVWDPETSPSEISLIVWPETGEWCSKEVLADKINAGSGHNYISFEVLEASSWNPETERIERELDQGYYITIEVQEFIKDFKYVQSLDPQIDKEKTLGRDYAYVIKKLNEYQMKSIASTVSGGNIGDAIGGLKKSDMALKR